MHAWVVQMSKCTCMGFESCREERVHVRGAGLSLIFGLVLGWIFGESVGGVVLY